MMPMGTEPRTLGVVEESFEVIDHGEGDFRPSIRERALDNEYEERLDNRPRSSENGNDVFVDASAARPAPLSMNGESSNAETFTPSTRRTSSKSSMSSRPSLDQIRSSLMYSLNTQEIEPREMVDRLLILLSENRQQREKMKRQNVSLQQGVERILQLREENAKLIERDRFNFQRTKELIENLKGELRERDARLAAKDAEIVELSRFRVNAADYLQKYENAVARVKQQDAELTKKDKELKESRSRLERRDDVDKVSPSSDSDADAAAEFEPVADQGDFILELMDKTNQLEMQKTALTEELEASKRRAKEYLAELENKRQAEFHRDTEMIGLRDTIDEHKREVAVLKKQIEELQRHNTDLTEESNVKDLMDAAQIAMIAEEKTVVSEKSMAYDSAASIIPTNELLERMESLRAELEATKKKEDELKSQLSLRETQLLQQTLKTEEIAGLRAQVVSLVEELSKTKEERTRAKALEQEYERFKTQKEIDEEQNRSILAQFKLELEAQMERATRELGEASEAKRELRSVERALEAAKKDLAEKESIIEYFQSQSSDGADQRLLFAEQELKKLRFEVDRLTAQSLAAEDVINEKDEQLSRERKENGKLRAKVEDIGMLQAQAQVYKEDFEQERQARDKMAREKEQVKTENQQLHDQIAHLNDLVQGATQFVGVTQPTPSSPAANGTFPRARSQNSGLGEPNGRPHYTLADREAAASHGRFAPPSTPPGIQRGLMNGAFAMSNGSPRPERSLMTDGAVGRSATTARVEDTFLTPAESGAGAEGRKILTPAESGAGAEGRKISVLVPKSPSTHRLTSEEPTPTATTMSELSQSPLEVSDEWQLLREDMELICPKCRAGVSTMDLLQVHILECLDS